MNLTTDALASNIADDLMADADDRLLLDGVDDNIRLEIFNAWQEIVAAEINKALL